MFGSSVLEVAIGVVFVYWLLGLLCSTINEQVIVPILGLRAHFLEKGIRSMLDNPQGIDLTGEVYAHPLIQGLAQKTRLGKVRKPSYIAAELFARALRDILQAITLEKPDFTLTALEALKGAQVIPSTPVPASTVVNPAPSEAEPTSQSSVPAGIAPRVSLDPTQELALIEKWFNDTMDRVTGWYKRRVQLIIFILGLIIVLGLNIDTLSLITNLTNNTAIRASIVSASQGALNSQSKAGLSTIQSSIEQLQPIIGWSALPADAGSWSLKVVGLLATTMAASLGAPFWFDLLNKFMSFRSSGPPPNSKGSNSGKTGDAGTNR